MIYLDYAATTPLDPGVQKKMHPFFRKNFGNPSSIHSFGREARAAVDRARNDIAQIFHAKPKEIVFTGSGTEANNWAIFGLAEAHRDKGNHIISTVIEHHSVLEPLQQLEQRGFNITYLKVDRNGRISLNELAASITSKTIVASIMYANNEIGTIQNVKDASSILHEKKVILHTDACQATGSLLLNVEELGVDAMTINGGKMYGPKGIGALYVKEGCKIVPLLFGGGQEHRMRAGTENVPGIIGLAEALKIAEQLRPKESKRLITLRDYFIKKLHRIPGLSLNGHPTQRLPNNINISIKGVDAESVLFRLDMAGIAASSAAACTSGSLEPSHVLNALGLPKELVKSGLRFSLGRETTKKQLDSTFNILKGIISSIRK